MEPTTVGSLWLENDLHENEREFESHIWEDRKKCRRYFRRDSRGNPRDLNMCRTGRSAALSRRRKSMPPIGVLMKRESMKLVVQQHGHYSANLRKITVTWMSWHYVFTAIFRWSTFSSTINLCNINCVIFSDTHCSFGPPILWHSPFHAFQWY